MNKTLAYNSSESEKDEKKIEEEDNASFRYPKWLKKL